MKQQKPQHQQRAVGIFLTLWVMISPTFADAPLELTLKIKPHLCLRYAEKDSCKIEVLTTWRAQQAGDYCLHSSADEQAIECWRMSKGDSHTELRVLNDDLSYWLSHPDSPAKLVEKTVEIATIVKNGKRKVRSRRHIWSLI